MPTWKKLVIATGSSAQYIKGDGTLGSYSTSDSSKLPLTGGTLTGSLNIFTSGGDANLRLRSGATRSGLFIDKPATTTTMGSALVLADSTFRLGTASYYHMEMTQAGNTLLKGGGGTALTLDSSQDSTFSGDIVTYTSNNYARLKGHVSGLQIKSSSSGYTGISSIDTNGVFKFTLFGNGDGYGFLNSEWGGWDIKKVISGKLYLNNSNTYYLQPDSLTHLNTLSTVGNATFGGDLIVNAKQIRGGFGAETTDGTKDWNHVTNARSGNGYTLLLGSATNGPTGSQYYHTLGFEYQGKLGANNLTQIGIPYTGAGIVFRSRYSGGWSAYKKVLDNETYSDYAVPKTGGTFTSALASVELATTSNGAYAVRSASPAKFSGYYFNSTSGSLYKNDGTPFLTFANDKKATFYGHIFLPSTGTSTPTNRYIATNNSSTGTGSLTIQAGEGSAGYGGGLILYSHSHASNAGWVKAGISVNSGGKFAVNSHGTGGGTDVFTVDASGNTVINGDINLTGTRYIKATNDLHLWADNTAMASFWTSGGNEYALLRGTAKAQDKFEQIGTLTNSFGGGATFGGDVNMTADKFLNVGGAISKNSNVGSTAHGITIQDANAPTLSLYATGNAGYHSHFFQVANNAYIRSSGNLLMQTNAGTVALTLDTSQNATFAGTLLIDGVSNYSGLEIKGAGGARPSIKLSNVNNGVIGSIYGTEGNALIFSSGTGGATALTLDSSQNATFAKDLIVGTHNSNSHRLEIESKHASVPFGQIVAGSADNNQAVGFQFVTRNSDGNENNRMYLTSTGLGIGTNAPVSSLQIAGVTGQDGLRVYNRDGGIGVLVNQYGTLLTYNGYLGTSSSGVPFYFQTGGVTRLTLSSTTATFGGEVRIQKDDGHLIIQRTSSTHQVQLWMVGNNGYVGSTNATPFHIRVANSNALSINTSQNATFYSNLTVNGGLYAAGAIYADENIYHNGDTDNKIRFEANKVTLSNTDGTNILNPTAAGTSRLYVSAIKALDTNSYKIGGISTIFKSSAWLSATVSLLGPALTGYGTGIEYLKFDTDGTNKRAMFQGTLGIGVQPTVKFQIDTPDATEAFRISSNGDAWFKLYKGQAGLGGMLELKTESGASNVSLQSSSVFNSYINAQGGKLGIGNTNPDRVLTVTGDIGASTNIVAGASLYSNELTTRSGQNLYIKTAGGTVITRFTDALSSIFSGDVYPVTNNTKTLGTASYKWSNVHTTNLNASGASVLGATLQLNNSGKLQFAGTDTYILGNAQYDYIQIQPNAATTYRFNQTGLGIATNDPQELLHVKKSSGDVGVTIESVAGGTTPTLRIKAPASRAGVIEFWEGGSLKSNIWHSTDDSLNFNVNSANDNALSIASNKDASFAGNVDADGLYTGVFLETFSHNFSDDLGTSEVYIPWGTDTETSNMNYFATAYLAPFTMELVKVLVRPESIVNPFYTLEIKIKAQGNNSQTVSTIATANAGTLASNSMNTTLASAFNTTPSCPAGRKIGMSFKTSGDVSGTTDWWVTSVWKVTKTI